MYTHVNTPSEEVFLLDISFLRAKREKKIKAMERDVIFFPRIFERPPVREIYGDRKKERKKERQRETCTKKPPYVFFTPRGIHYGSTTTILSHFFPPIISSSSSSPSFTPFIILPSGFYMVINSIFVLEAIYLSREKQ